MKKLLILLIFIPFIMAPTCPPCECPDPKPCPKCPECEECEECNEKKCPKCPSSSSSCCCEVLIDFYLDGNFKDNRIWCEVPNLNEQVLFDDNTIEATVVKVVWHSQEYRPASVLVYCQTGMVASVRNVADLFGESEKACFIQAVGG